MEARVSLVHKNLPVHFSQSWDSWLWSLPVSIPSMIWTWKSAPWSLSLSLSRIWQYCWIHAVPSIMAIFNFLIILRNHSWSHPIASHNAEKANMNISRNIRVFNASCSSNAEMKGETSVFRYRDKCNIIPKYPFTLLFLYNHSIRVLKLFRKLIWNVHFIRVFSHWFHLHYFYTVQEIYRSKFSFIF